MIAYSIGGGIVLSILVIVIGNKFYPAIPVVSTPNDNNNSEAETETSNENTSVDSTVSDGSTPENTKWTNIKERQKAVERIYGLDDGAAERADVNYVKIIDWVIFAGLLLALFVVSNSNWDNGIVRLLAGMFPREFSALGLNKYLAETPPSAAEMTSTMTYSSEL